MKHFFRTLISVTLTLFLFSTLQAQEYADPTKTPEKGKAPGLKVKLLSTSGKTKTYILIFSKGDEIVAGLTEFAKTNNIKSGHYSGIGDALSIKAGWFDYKVNKFKVNPIDTAEVTSLTGDIAWYKGNPVAHTHINVSLKDGSVKGGHLLELISGPTIEIVLVAEPTALYKKLDPEYEAALIDPEAKGEK